MKYAIFGVLIVVALWYSFDDYQMRGDINRNTVSLGALRARVDSLEGASAYDRLTDKPVGYWTYHPPEEKSSPSSK